MEMTPRISLLLPTRGRPALVRRFFDSVIRNTRDLSRVEAVLYVDDDDVESHALLKPGINGRTIVGPRASMGRYNTTCYEESVGDVIVLVNDDMVIGTKGWDDKLIELDNSVADKIYLAYGNDLLKGGKLCTFPILSRRTCELLGDPYPLEYEGAFIDYHLFDVFKRLEKAGYSRIFYLKDLIFEHLHYRTGKAAKDATYVRRGRFADDPIFVALKGRRERAAEHLRDCIVGKECGERLVGDRAVIDPLPGSLFRATSLFMRTFLLDGDLPWRWRVYLSVWFLGRYMAARGMLKPFVKVS